MNTRNSTKTATSSGGIASSMAPSFAVVNRYFAAAIASFVILCLLLVLNAAEFHGHYFQPQLLALTHLAMLGWVSMTIFGAMYQLVPVVLEVRLFSERIAFIQFWIYLLGLSGLIAGFWSFRVGYHLAASATLVTVAIFLFIFNMLVTLSRVTNWNLTGLYILASLVYLGLTAIAGFLLALNLGFPFISRIHLDYLKIHAHLGFVGWVVMVIMGVGLKLIPMFGLSHGFSTAPAKVALVLVNLGLIGTTLEWLLDGPQWLLQIYIILLLLGLISFVVQLVLIFRKRVRRLLDVGMKHSAVAFTYFFLSTLLGGIIAFTDIEHQNSKEAAVLAYGVLISLGCFSMLIVGQMYKIVPFLVWFHTFSDKVGKEPVPMLKDMFSERIATVQFWFINAGIVVVLAGVLASNDELLLLGFSFLLAASLLFSFNMASVLYLKVRHGDERTDS